LAARRFLVAESAVHSVIFSVVAQIKKHDVHSYSKVIKEEHVPIWVRMPPLKKPLPPSFRMLQPNAVDLLQTSKDLPWSDVGIAKLQIN
jgi:hypothetical protein